MKQPRSMQHPPSSRFRRTVLVLAAISACCAVSAQQSGASGNEEAELAKKLANPIANLVSVPLRLNWDTGIGPADANQATWLFQPVVPFSLNTDWNLITRTIVPYVDLQSPMPGGPSESGFGDTTQSFFFSPQALTDRGWIWGAGPVGYYATSSNSLLASRKWGAGLTAVLLKQDKGWTYGVLANHIWSLVGPSGSADYSNTFIQPFLSYTTRTYTTLGVNTESTYDWKNRQWTIPLNLTVGQILKIRSQPLSLTLGLREFLDRPAGGPNWGYSATVTFLFPKK